MTFERVFGEASRLPLRVRRPMLRVACGLERLARAPKPTPAGEEMRRTLRMASRDAARIEHEIAFINRLYDLEWKAVLDRKVEDLAEDSTHLTISDRPFIQQLAAQAKPIILAPIHMGAFALPFARLVRDLFPGRPMLILRAREDREHETKAMRRVSEIGTQMRFLNIRDKDNYFAAVRFVRDGGIIVSFIDLPGSYGGPTHTNLFGRPIQLAVGIDSLARLTEATVLPMAVSSSLNGDRIDIGQSFEVAERGAEERLRVTNLIKHHLEQSILRAPHQWFMWPRLAEYLVPASYSGAA